MTLERTVSRFFVLDDETWMRHANPWSFWTRLPILLAFVVAIWSRIWVGRWAVIPVAILIVWTFVNPRAFRKPDSTKNWVSKAVFGERIWKDRDRITIPEHHHRFPTLLTGIALLGILFIIWGVYHLHIWPTILGLGTTYIGKLWYLDRMVWLYNDMKEHEEYQKWLY